MNNEDSVKAMAKRLSVGEDSDVVAAASYLVIAIEELAHERAERAKDRAQFEANVKALEGDKAELQGQLAKLKAAISKYLKAPCGSDEECDAIAAMEESL